MHKYALISVAGPIASGKTTVAKLLADKLHLRLLEENPTKNIFLPRFYKSPKRWAFHSQTYFLLENIQHARKAAILLEHNSVVQDTPIYQNVFSYAKAQLELGYMEDGEWELYLKLFDQIKNYLPKPNLIIYLKTNTANLLMRISARGRGYEKNIDGNYLELLESLNQKWIVALKIPVVTIQTDEVNLAKSYEDQLQFVQTIESALEKM